MGIDSTADPSAPHRHWLRWIAVFWLIAAAALVALRWKGIVWFALPDTDDNLRIAQVRALIAGQDWFDLRQYRLDPPLGADIHWSRLIDLPIAGIFLALKPFIGGANAERAAVALAPLIPLGVAMAGLALSVRRLIAPGAFALGIAMLICASSAMGMWSPLRIDHHGWQLAMLTLVVAGLADPNPARGGVTAGIATAVSLSIGLELLPYLAITAGALGLRWVWDRAEAPRIAGYGAALGAGCALGFVLFASYANRNPVCDALSPVWLSVTVAGGGLLLLLSRLPIAGRGGRLAAAVVAGAAVVGLYVLAWPHCLGMLEGISPEARRLWFANIREVRPIYTHGATVALSGGALPAIGLIGALFEVWKRRREPQVAAWASVAAVAGLSAGLLLWQARAGPAAQLLAIPGAVALNWRARTVFARSDRPVIRTVGPVLSFYVLSGIAVATLVLALPKPVAKPSGKIVATANRRCPTLPALKPIARMPAQTIFTFVDLGPRLIAVTHHNAIAGPYHRNYRAILDVHHAFRGQPDQAHAIIRRHGATLLLICPGMSESTLYSNQAPKGFYAGLIKGQVPDWLVPVPLPRNSPFKLWQVVR